MKLKISLLGLLCLFFRTYAQPGNNHKALKTGDKLPDMQISGILNYEAGGKPADQVRLSQFNDKLLILDFWGTYCTPCLHLLPRYDSLQRVFAGKVQFLLVTREKSRTVQAFFKRNTLRLPSVTDDYLLSALFPHNSIPFEVWIRNGVVVAMTYGEDVNAVTIGRVLEGDTNGIAQRKDDLNIDPLEPLLVNGNGSGQALFQSVITGYLPGVSSPEGFRRTPEKIVAVALNHSPLALYQQALVRKDPMFDLANRCAVELPDSLRRMIDQGGGPGFHEWIKRYGFSYQLTLPPGFSGDVSEVMLADLNRFFGARYRIGAALEKRETDCLVLSRVPGAASIESKGGKPVFAEKSGSLTIGNLGIGSLDMEIAQRFRKLPAPFVDETGYDRPIDLVLRCGLSDLAALQKELRKAGLDLSIKKRVIELLVIQPTNHTKTL